MLIFWFKRLIIYLQKEMFINFYTIWYIILTLQITKIFLSNEYSKSILYYDVLTYMCLEVLPLSNIIIITIICIL